MNDTPQSPPIKGLGKLIHIAGWGILFCSPFFFTGRESQVTFEGYFRSIIVPLSFMLVFYLNYGWLVRRYLFNRRTGRFLLINLLLIKMATEKGRSVRPDLKCGICGEHGGEPSSVKFCHRVGLNYVSCSPFRVPIARLAAAQAAVEDTL